MTHKKNQYVIDEPCVPQKLCVSIYNNIITACDVDESQRLFGNYVHRPGRVKSS